MLTSSAQAEEAPADTLDPSLELAVLIRVGSHLYGTATPASDLDIKGVYLPKPEAILLQRVEPVIRIGPDKKAEAKSGAGDVEIELFSLGRFLDLLVAGQTIALDLLFAPATAMLRAPAPVWTEIQAATPHLVSREAGSFLRYARRQAALFGTKGARLSAARAVLTLLQEAIPRHGNGARLETLRGSLDALTATYEHCRTVALPTVTGSTLEHFDLGGRRVPFTASLARAAELARAVIATYGRRAREAATHGGVDWKASSHAVRVGRQALELLGTGRITFPLACAPHLLAIKQGRLPYANVAEEIEALVAEVERAAGRSALPAASDRALADQIVLRAYAEIV